MEITCNGTKRELAQDSLLLDFLKSLDLDPDTVVVECNGVIVSRDEYGRRILRDGEKLELIRFVGGG